MLCNHTLVAVPQEVWNLQKFGFVLLGICLIYILYKADQKYDLRKRMKRKDKKK